VEEIQQRLLYPMVNRSAKILEEDAIRASDIDVIGSGYGWPVYRGGHVLGRLHHLKAVQDQMLAYKAGGRRFLDSPRCSTASPTRAGISRIASG
jgi:hypothetical protein